MAEVIHPAVRLSLLIIAATATSIGSYSIMAITTAVVAFCYWYCPNSGLDRGVKLLKRMRWFFLSIAFVYFWFTPGQVLFSVTGSLSAWLPSIEGVELGLHRIFILMLIILMVNLLLRTTPQDRLLVAIYWWLRPTKYLGMNPKKIALRISLVLDFVQQGQELIAETKRAVLVSSDGKIKKTRLLGVAVGEVIHQAELRANQQPTTLISLPVVDNPSIPQWLMPITVLVGYWLLWSLY